MDRLYRSDENAYAELLKLIRSGRAAVLATVVRTEGSSPQVPGASAVFTAEGLACGTVGGGSVEGRTADLARAALAGGHSVLADFDLSNEVFEDAEGVCGGAMTVLVDAHPGRNARALAGLVSDVRRRRAGVLAAFFERGRAGRVERIVRRWIPSGRGPATLSRSLFPGFASALEAARSEARTGWLESGRRRVYLEPHEPRPRLIVAGAGHVGRAIARLGAFLGFEIVVVDDRPEFASRGRFPEAARVVVADPAASLKKMPLGGRDYVVIVTRGHRGDEAALRVCIRRRPAYLGMIGSRRKIAMMRERFLRSGAASEKDWARLHAPIGLPIGSRTVEEIAVSVAAELVRENRRAG